MAVPAGGPVPPRVTVVGLPLVVQEEGNWRLRVGVQEAGGAAREKQINLTGEVARRILGGEESKEYRLAVEQAMQRVSSARDPKEHKRAVAALEDLVNRPTTQVRDWMKLGLGKKRVSLTDWQKPAEQMRARLEHVRQVVQATLRSRPEDVNEALTGALNDLSQVQFQTGAAATTERKDQRVVGELIERVPSRALAESERVHLREEPRALTAEILQSLDQLWRIAPEPQKAELKRMRNALAPDPPPGWDPSLVWNDRQSREILRLTRDHLRELAQYSERLATQVAHSTPPERALNNPNRKLWYAFWWADQLGAWAQERTGGRQTGVEEALGRLERREQTDRQEEVEKRHLTQSARMEMRGPAARPMSEEAQRMMGHQRGSYLVEQLRPGANRPDQIVVSHRYDPDARLESGLSTVPSAAGKHAPVLTSARTLYDVESGQSFTAHGRLNTVDRLLETQTFLLAELYENPDLAAQLGDLLQGGIPTDQKAAWEGKLRHIQLPTGMEWKETEQGALEWTDLGSGHWKPRLEIRFLDLNLLTPGLGGPDSGDQPEWAPATALWRRGQKGAAVALVASRLLGLPYLAEKMMAKFLAEQRWSEQEAASTDFLRGQQFELMGIPVELNTMMVNRPLNVWAEGGSLHTLPMPSRVSTKMRTLSESGEQALKSIFDRKLHKLQQQKRDWDPLQGRSYSSVKEEYLNLLRAGDPATQKRQALLREFLHSSAEQREQRQSDLNHSIARLEGLWKVAFDLDWKSTPEARILALVELSKELNVRIGAHCKSGKDRTGTAVALFCATRQWFRQHPRPQGETARTFTTADEWANYFNNLPSQPLFQASFANYDEILSQQQADMMQWDRKLDRSDVPSRIAGTELASHARPYDWVERSAPPPAEPPPPPADPPHGDL